MELGRILWKPWRVIGILCLFSFEGFALFLSKFCKPVKYAAWDCIECCICVCNYFIQILKFLICFRWTWLLATFLDHKRCCYRYVESGTKWLQCPVLSLSVKCGCTWENNIPPLTGLLILSLGSQMSKWVISRPIKYFAKFSILIVLLLAKKTSQISYTAS